MCFTYKSIAPIILEASIGISRHLLRLALGLEFCLELRLLLGLNPFCA